MSELIEGRIDYPKAIKEMLQLLEAKEEIIKDLQSKAKEMVDRALSAENKFDLYQEESDRAKAREQMWRNEFERVMSLLHKADEKRAKAGKPRRAGTNWYRAWTEALGGQFRKGRLSNGKNGNTWYSVKFW